jgi:magnesium transporter
VITIYSYNVAEGTLSNPSIAELPGLVEAENLDLWVDLETATPEESEILGSAFNFHELAIEDCVALEIEEAKIDDYEDYLFLVFHSVHFNSEQLIFDVNELDIFFSEKYVVTYHKKPVPAIHQLRKRLDKRVDIMSNGTDELLHAVLDAIVDNYSTSFKKVEREIYRLEGQILADPSHRTFNEIFRLRRGLISLRRILAPGEEVLEDLGTKEHELIQEENRVYFQDVHDHMSTVHSLLGSYMEMVSGTMDTYMSLTTHRMTSVMRTLTILSFIILPLTLLASLFGMNLNLPLQNDPNGFLIIIFLDLMIVGGLLWYFKKRDWF